VRVLKLGYGFMFITYRRTGGIFALLTFAAVAFAATLLTVVVAATVLIVALGTAAAVLLARAVLPASGRHHPIPRPTPWPRDTIEATVVHHDGSSDKRDLRGMGSDKG
jgi:hypothetical protein